jgi:2-iminobutanoate/2-iminopropanoate deaminase
MTLTETGRRVVGRIDSAFSRGEIVEMTALGLLDADGSIVARPPSPPQVERKRISAPDVLNEAWDYASSFSRGTSMTLEAGHRILWLSGTASIDGAGRTLYAGDFRAQLWRTYRNLTRLLEAEGATWSDIARTTCYLRDIERDYDVFNQVRTLFLDCMSVSPAPTSTGIQARLCRSDLLVEIEAFAVVREGGPYAAGRGA